MERIAREAEENPKLLLDAPLTTPVSRLDEARAAKNPVVKYGFAEHPQHLETARALRWRRRGRAGSSPPRRRSRSRRSCSCTRRLNPTPFHHARSAGALALMAVLAALVLGFVPRVPSASAALGAGLAAGGALAMLVSGLVWQQGAPDPLVGGGYAFNLADISIALGDAMLLAAVLVHAWANRHSLRQTI